MTDNKITYKEIKAKQGKNLKSIYYNIYRRFSTPFTYVFVKLGFSPSAVSILNLFPALIGYFFLATGNYFLMGIGLLFFILYKIWDCSDGEVARIQNPKAMDPKHKKVEGMYFDAVAHFIEPIFFGAGLGVGLYKLYNTEMYITFGIFLAVIFTLEYALRELVRSYFRKGIIEKKIKLKKELKYIQKELNGRMVKGHSWQEQNIIFKIFGFYPPGLIYSREYIDPMLVFAIIIEFVSGKFINIPFDIFGQAIGILSIYLFVVGIVKLTGIISFITKMVKNKYLTNFLNEL
tara:strand:+ start:8227 stop:9096 length:870 start_codon:yes stop_codon:yes gene_type:complete